MYCHVHQAQLGIVFHLLLTVEGHGHIRVRAILLSEVRRGNEHAAAAASGIYKDAVFDTNRKSLLWHISAEKGLK